MRSPHVPEAFALAGLREEVDYVLACAYGHAAGDHRDVTPAGDDCGGLSLHALDESRGRNLEHMHAGQPEGQHRRNSWPAPRTS